MEKKWYQRPLPDVIAETDVFAVVKSVLSRIVLPGFSGLPLWYVLSFFYKGLQHGSVGIRAAALSYNFFLAIFPGILFFFTLIPYLPIKNLNTEILQLMRDLMPEDIYNISSGTVTDIVSRKRTGLLSLVLFTSLYFSSSGITSIINAFNRTYHTFEVRKWWQQRLVSMTLTLMGFIAVIATAVLFLFSDIAVTAFMNKQMINTTVVDVVVNIIKYLFVIFMAFLGISTLYFYGPSKRKGHFKFFSPGSIVATVLFLASSYGFSVYLTYFNSYNKLYGSIGTIILLLVWINLNAWVLLLGFELNASIRSARHTRDADQPQVGNS
jgi:membrane protein